MDETIQKAINNRKRKWLGLETHKEIRKDYFDTTKSIALGTFRPFDDFEENETQNWYKVKIPSEFNWMLWSSAGTYKSKLVQTMLPYFHKKGYYICIVEAKDETLSMSLKKHAETHRIYPDAYNVEVPIVAHLPSYTISPNLSPVDRIEPELVRKFDKIVTLKSGNINTALEWKTLFKAADTGADILHILNKSPDVNGSLKKMDRQLKKGFFKDDKGRRVNIHYGTKASIARVLENIKIDDFLNSKGKEEINLEECWNQGKIPTICFFQKRPAYMRIYVNKLIEQQYNFSRKMKKARGKDIKILNIFDDCQMFLNTQSDENNPANAAVKNTIRMGRSFGFNNIFTVQDIVDFNLGIYNGCELFVGYIRDFGNARMLTEHKEMIEANRKLFREIPLPNGYTRKIVPYYHIPKNDNLATTFFPNDPLSGGF